MYLAVLLIIVALLVFYNEINSKMNITEYILLFIALIAIIKAALNYIKFDTAIEGFSTNTKTKEKFNLKKVEYKKDETDDEDDDTMIINSNDSLEYLDSDEINNDNKKISNSFINSIDIDNANTENKKSSIAINEVNQLLGISSNFTDIPIPTSTNFAMPTNYKNDDDEIKSIFSPKVIIGKGSKDNTNGFGKSGNSSSWNSVFNNDGFGFNNTMNPVNNLWRDEHGYYNSGSYNSNSTNSSKNCSNSFSSNITNDEWSQGMDAYNKGKWQRNQYNRPSDYIDYTSPIGYGTTTPNSPNPTIYGNTSSESLNPSTNTISASTPTVASSNDKRKLCGGYTDLDENHSDDLVIKEYTQAKNWVAGYTYVPPINWDVPQRHAPVCSSVTPNVHKLTGLMDRGLPINALELTTDGRIANTEDTVKLSNVGSMIPKFNYQEQPFSKPYV